MRSIINLFRDEFVAHVKERSCPFKQKAHAL